MPEQGVKFDQPSARRIARAVKEWERNPVDITGDVQRKGRPVPETVWAKLLCQDQQDRRRYSWIEVRPTADGTAQENPVQPRQGDWNNQPAVDYNAVAGFNYAHSIVLLRRVNRPATDANGNPTFNIEWEIVLPPREFWAVIVCCGPAAGSGSGSGSGSGYGQDCTAHPDFTDHRYWFKSARINNSGNPTDPITVAIEDPASPYYVHASLTNLSEQDTKAHGLTPGDVVRVWLDYDDTGNCSESGSGTGSGEPTDATSLPRYVTSTAAEDHWVGEIVCSGNCAGLERCAHRTATPTCGELTQTACPERNGDKDCCTVPPPPCTCTQFEDNRYWVVRGRWVQLSGGGVIAGLCDPPVWEQYDVCDPRHKKIVALNLSENNCQTHTLRPGTLVHVFQRREEGTDPAYPTRTVYWFEHTEDCGDRNCDCPTSGSNSGSSGSGSGSGTCCDCYEVTVSLGEDPIQMQKAGPTDWTNESDTSYIQHTGGGWQMTIEGTVYTAADGPCPPTDVAAWSPAGLLDIHCCHGSGSGSGSGCCSCNGITNIEPTLSNTDNGTTVTITLTELLTYCDGTTQTRTTSTSFNKCCGSGSGSGSGGPPTPTTPTCKYEWRAIWDCGSGVWTVGSQPVETYCDGLTAAVGWTPLPHVPCTMYTIIDSGHACGEGVGGCTHYDQPAGPTTGQPAGCCGSGTGSGSGSGSGGSGSGGAGGSGSGLMLPHPAALVKQPAAAQTQRERVLERIRNMKANKPGGCGCSRGK